jgi:ligand-binding SRPBCC domain-containing protein
LTSKITAFERPRHFRDRWIAGAFRRFDHDHFFELIGEQTRIKDVFDYDSPLGILGKIADAFFVEKHLREMLRERNQIIKAAAENGDWRKFLDGTALS